MKEINRTPNPTNVSPKSKTSFDPSLYPTCVSSRTWLKIPGKLPDICVSKFCSLVFDGYDHERWFRESLHPGLLENAYFT